MFCCWAGASRTSGIKSGQELVDYWDNRLLLRNEKDCLTWKMSLGIDDKNKYSFYSHFYDKVYKRNPADGYNFLEKQMEHAKPSSGYVMLAYLLSKTYNNVVITTNFDHLIEDAVNYYIQDIPLVIGHESLSHYVTKDINRPTIIKIHRDLLFNPANKVNEVETLHDSWKKALEIIFSEYNPVFIGYAGNDNSLMDYLIENSDKFADIEFCCPYWMLYKNDKAEGKIKEFIEKSNGYVIRHGGFDETLYQLGAAFGYKMPSKEEFIKDAEKRFQNLSDSIDTFTNLLAKMEDADNSILKSEEKISEAVRKVTSNAEISKMFAEAMYFYSSGQYENSILEFRKLIQLSPENALYHNNLGVTLHEMERYAEALEEKKKAVKLEPENAQYHDSLGATLHVMTRYGEALEEAEKAVELEPENEKYRDCLGVALHVSRGYE